MARKINARGSSAITHAGKIISSNSQRMTAPSRQWPFYPTIRAVDAIAG
jgi:hypothetical protein